MKVVVEGCCHGELDKIYETILRVEEREGIKIDLLICCGDFQAVRDDADLNCMAVPHKYRHMNTFYKYYSGEKVAPVTTLFVGGNHEASNHLWELSYGGWVAPKIYYLGNAGVVRYGGLRIGGLSGIYKPRDYGKGHFECPPYSEDTKRSAYHVRSCDIFRLKQLSGQVDIVVSHDWPQGIYHHGNKEELLRWKPFFADEIATDTLGSPPAMELLKLLKPLYWFSAHLHVKFAAVFRHEEEGRYTKFLALDKCLPRRKFLQILDIPTSVEGPYGLDYDPEWLAILRSTEPLMRYSPALWLPPHPMTDERHTFTPSLKEIDNIRNLFQNNLHVPDNFTQTVSPYNPVRKINFRAVAQPHENPQTTEFCRKLCIHNPFTPNFKSAPSGGFWVPQHVPNPDEIPLSGSDDSGSEGGEHTEENDGELPPGRDGGGEGANPDEIAISDSEEEADIPTSSSSVMKEGKRVTVMRDSMATVPRTPLVLPEPECVPGANTLEGGDIQLMEESDNCLSEGQALSHGGDVAPREDSDQQPAGEEGSGQIRKIKRRNLAIYATREDQEEL